MATNDPSPTPASLRDLSYRRYDGERLPPTRNTWVLTRQGLARSWRSILVKVGLVASLLVGGGGVLLALAAVGLSNLAANQASGPAFADGTAILRSLLRWEEWVCMLIVAAGAGVVPRDREHGAFAFYFAKPITEGQYLAGRTIPVAVLILASTIPSGALMVGWLSALAPAGLRAGTALLLVPTLAHGLFIACTLAPIAVAMSTLSASSGMSLGAWLLLLIVPHFFAAGASAVAGAPSLQLASIPGLYELAGDAIFGIDAAQDPQAAALLLLLALAAGATLLAMQRIRSQK